MLPRPAYTRGVCDVHITTFPYVACNARAGFVPIPQPKLGDVRAPIRAFAAPDGRGIRVRFRAPQGVIDGRSDYNIEVRPEGGNGFATQNYAHDIDAGALVHTTVDLYNHQRGPYRIVVRYRTVPSRPGPTTSLVNRGLFVGHARVVVP